MKRILKFLIKWLFLLGIFLIVYRVFDKEVDLFNWFMGSTCAFIFDYKLKNDLFEVEYE